MKALVDTSVWSPALRRKPKSNGEELAVHELRELAREGRVVMIGPIRQELLSGWSNRAKCEELREKLRAFEDWELTREYYETAAEISNGCRRHGVQGSAVDFPICAVGRHADVPIFALDMDFERYRPLRAHQAPCCPGQKPVAGAMKTGER